VKPAGRAQAGQQPVKSMAVFEAPPVPGCWEGRELIRIVDPLGLQVAWVSPALAGGIVGYYARASSNDGWTEVLACAAPGDSHPGWQSGSELLLRDEHSQTMVPAWGSDATWSFESRDPTQTTVHGTIGDHALKVSLSCIDGELQIVIEPGDASTQLTSAGLRLHVGHDAGTLDRDDARNQQLVFRNGALSSLAYTHSPGIACQAGTSAGGGECQVDFVPRAGSQAPGPATPIIVTLCPVPAGPAG
jgi:hypothetical protein